MSEQIIITQPAGTSGFPPDPPTDDAVALGPDDVVVAYQNAVLVSGAGTSAANGTYTYRGQFLGKAYYTLEGQPDSVDHYGLSWDGGQWLIYNSNGTVGLYINSTDDAFPWQGSWATKDGDSPAPTVTALPTCVGVSPEVLAAGLGIPYGVKRYVALLTQSGGTDAPVATVLENTLGEVPIWSYVAAGLYELDTMAGIFLSDKTFLTLGTIPQVNEEPARLGSLARSGDTAILLSIGQTDLTGAFNRADISIGGVSCVIEVYP